MYLWSEYSVVVSWKKKKQVNDISMKMKNKTE